MNKNYFSLGALALFALIVTTYCTTCGSSTSVEPPMPELPTETDADAGNPPIPYNNCVDHQNESNNLPNQITDWQIQELTPLSFGADPYSSLFFFNPEIGFIQNGSGAFKTTDGGTSWKVINFNGTSTVTVINSIRFFDDQNGVCVRANNYDRFEVFCTADQGETWKPWPLTIPTYQYISTVTFSSPSTMWVLASDQQNLVGAQVTRDSGRTWQTYTIGNQSTTGCNIQFVHPDTGFLAVGRNELYKTTDGGQSWQTSYLGGLFSDMGVKTHFINGQLGYLYGPKGIQKTTDAGQTWQVLSKRPTFGFGYLPDQGLLAFEQITYCDPNLTGQFLYNFPKFAFTTRAVSDTTWKTLSSLTQIACSNWAPAGPDNFFFLDSAGRLYHVWR